MRQAHKFPPRKIFGPAELKAVERVFKHAWKTETDFGFQGHFESEFCSSFTQFQKINGYADAVSSGTAALYVILKALEIKTGDLVLISPITSPGGITPAIEVGARLVVADSKLNSNCVCLDSIKQALKKYPKIKAVVLTHAAGQPVHELDQISKYLKRRKIFFIEDCSQSHGATYKNKRVGNFSDVSFFSTMFSKTIPTGGCGGVTLTQNRDLYLKMLSFSDRGKNFSLDPKERKDARTIQFSSLNFNQNEIACAIGSSILSRAEHIISKRQGLLKHLQTLLLKTNYCKVIECDPEVRVSPFYIPVFFSNKKIQKKKFAEDILSKGVPLNPHYSELVSDWGWAKSYIEYDFTKNARNFRDNTFNLFLHENYKKSDLKQIQKCILEVEEHYL